MARCHWLQKPESSESNRPVFLKFIRCFSRTLESKGLEIEILRGRSDLKRDRALFESFLALPLYFFTQTEKGPAEIAGPRQTVVQRLILRVVLLHVIACHLQRNDVHFILVG